jgi:hypothetical protein
MDYASAKIYILVVGILFATDQSVQKGIQSTGRFMLVGFTVYFEQHEHVVLQ